MDITQLMTFIRTSYLNRTLMEILIALDLVHGNLDQVGMQEEDTVEVTQAINKRVDKVGGQLRLIL